MRFLPLALALFASSVAHADTFVITATEDSKEVAQNKAAEKGGWVLDTNLYSALTPNKYAVVRGPYGKVEDAKEELKLLQQGKGYPGAFVKDAGKIRVGALFGGKSTPQVAAALLGELQVTLTEQPGKSNPCEPQEPYVDVELSWVTLSRGADGEGEANRQTIDIGSLAIIKRTGELQRMRVCWE